MSAQCPVCNDDLPTYIRKWQTDHAHDVGEYQVYYDVYTNAGCTTEVWMKDAVGMHVSRLFVLNGLLALDEERIEKLLVLR